LLRQSYKADKIILWLSEPQFEEIELPKLLLDQQKRGLEIRFVSEDVRAHKKYLYALQEYHHAYIITVDDDLYYDQDLIENLVNLKVKYPNCIPTNRCHKITFSESGNIQPYSKWEHNSTILQPSFLLVPTGGFGTMYLNKQLDINFSNRLIIQDLIPYADDLWMKVQSLLKETKIVTNQKYNKDPITVKSSQLEKLVTKNVFDGGNDLQLRKVLDYFNLGNLEKYRQIK